MTADNDPVGQSAERAEQVLRQLTAHRELLRHDAARSDECGTIGRDVIEMIRSSGGYRVASQAEIGATALVLLGAGIAQLHPSAAWNCMVSVTNALLVRRFAELSGFVLPEDLDTQWCGVFASSESTARRDGNDPAQHRVAGVWRYASNSDLADWAVLNVAHAELGACFVILPRDQLEERSRWMALGLRGTGSHTLGADGLAVPVERLLTAAELYREDPEGPLGLRLPARLRTAFGLAAVALGAGEALVGELAGSIASATTSGTRAPGMPGRGLDRPGVAVAVGDAGSRMRSARTALLDAAERLDRAAALGQPVPPTVLADARLMLSRVVRDISDAAHEISMIAGSRACLEGDAVGRLWRDTHIASRHPALSPSTGFELGGRGIVDPESSDAAAAAGPLAPNGTRSGEQA